MESQTLTSSPSADQAMLPSDVCIHYNLIVNLFFVGQPGAADGWTLVDCGLPLSAGSILHAAEERFGKGARPNAIVLTHGHFDHVGTLVELANLWDVPVWAHELEAPYLTGRSSYPPPDPTVGGGLMSRLSPLYPKGPVDVSSRLRLFPADGSIPPMPAWNWIHTPGHTGGHVSLFRPTDRTLIAGDAFVTTNQQSLIGSMSKYESIQGPPMYFTSDWEASRQSVRRLAELHPAAAFTGHGRPLAGEHLEHELARLVAHFDELALPSHGRYVGHPAITDERGVVSVPPPVADPWPKIAGAVAAAAIAGVIIARSGDHRDRQ